MKTYFKLLVLLLTPLFVISCNEIQDTNSPSSLTLTTYYKGKKFLGEDKVLVVKSYFEAVRVKIIPKNTNFKVLEESYYGGGYNMSYKGFQLPLRQNEGNYSQISPNPEEFRLIITHKNKEVFNEELQVFYIQYGKPFLTPFKTNRKNKDGKWELFSRHKIPIVDENGNKTDYEFEVDLAREQ